jgi:hypothetical protein
MSPFFTLLHLIHSSSNDSSQRMHSVSWSRERGSGVGFPLFDRLLTFCCGLWQLSRMFGLLFQLIFKRWWRQNLTFQGPSISDRQSLLWGVWERWQNLKHITHFFSIDLRPWSLSLWSLLEAKAEALVDGSGSFSVAAAWLQTWVVDCSA